MTFRRYLKRPAPKILVSSVVVGLAAAIAGCGTQKQPLTVELTQLGPYLSAAKPPDCHMPVLDALPLSSYSQVAIVEAWADVKDQSTDVLPALQRKACETGADALVIVNSEHQDIKNLLYAASPNETLNDVTKKNGYAGGGEYIQTAEHTRRIGEPGHNGFYIDAVAINYGPKAQDQAAHLPHATAPAPHAPTPQG
jgi:hypothetical protein